MHVAVSGSQGKADWTADADTEGLNSTPLGDAVWQGEWSPMQRTWSSEDIMRMGCGQWSRSNASPYTYLLGTSGIGLASLAGYFDDISLISRRFRRYSYRTTGKEILNPISDFLPQVMLMFCVPHTIAGAAAFAQLQRQYDHK